MMETPLLLTNVFSRRSAGASVSLDGPWKYIVDPYRIGYEDMMGDKLRRGFFSDFKPRHEGDRVEYSFDTGEDMMVPGDWNTQDPRWLYYEGTMWFRRMVTIDAAPQGRTFVHFSAVNHTCRVFFAGQEVAFHEGGFGPFSVEITDLATPGEHPLILMVDNDRKPERIPAMRSDWWNFGGIHRSVDLISVPNTFLSDAWLTMAKDGSLVGGVTIDGDGASVATATVTIGDLTLTADAQGNFSATVEQAAAFERWAPGAPVLHDATFTLASADGTVLDEIKDTIGLRTVETRGTEILVNGKPTYLYGISLHSEAPSGGSRAAGPQDAETLLGWAQDLGANFVRLAHYQHDEAMVREAERRGLLAWTELPVYWGIEFEKDDVLANAKLQLRELIIRDRSRAAVILWSVANETLPGDDRNAFLRSLVSYTRGLDGSRLVTAALLTLPEKDPVVHIDDPLGEDVDVIGVNEYLGWYYGKREDIADTKWTSDFGKPIVFSELGAGAKAGRHGSEDEVWTEEYQAAVYREQITMIRQQGDVAGFSPWILKDFRAPMRTLPGIQDGYNRKGLLSEEGERKLAFDVLADYYHEAQGLQR